MHLLFCNTFLYDAQASCSNWAVIKFPCMIGVDFIKIIAPGVKAHSQLRDDQYIGKTSPGKFRLEIFSDDRSASMTTYEHVGYLDYSEATHCEFRPASALYSEKLLLNGWFTRLTVAVYGGVLGDVGMPNPSIDLAGKAPSLVIHEKPEGRSVYIRGAQDLPKLTTELEKPEPLMASFPPSSKGYLGMDDSSGRRESGGYGNENIPNLHSTYYERRQPRQKSFNPDSGRSHHKGYVEERSEYLGPQQKSSGRKPPGTDREADVSTGRTDGNERSSYRDRNRQFTDQHPRHNKRDSSENSVSAESKQAVVSHTDIPTKRLSNSRDPSNSPRPTINTEAEESDANQDWVDAEYEEISDEEAEEERFTSLQELDEMIDGEEVPPTAAFNPFLTEPVQLMHFSHPGINDFEIACSNLLSDDDQAISQQGNEENAARFESLLTKAKKIGKIKSRKSLPALILGSQEGKSWVSVVEEIIPLVTVALPGFFVTSREKYDEYLAFLIASVFAGLDIGLASKQVIGINLRMLKCGINLAHKLCETTQDIVTFLTVGELDAKLVSLLQEDNMASSIKIMIIHTLDAYLSWPCALASYFQDNGKTKKSYHNLVELILVPQASRVATALSRLMNKISLFHAMWKLKNVVQLLVEEKVPQLPEEYEFEDDYIGEDIVEEDDAIGDDVEDLMVMSSVQSGEDIDTPRPLDAIKPVDKSCEYVGNDVDPLTSAVHVDNWRLSEESNMIIESLNLILRTLEDVGGTITQLPKRAFPTTINACNISEKSSVTCIFRLMEYYHVIPSIQVLLSLPFVSGCFRIYESAYKLLDFLMARQDGLLFMAFNSTHVTCLARHLMLSSVDMSEVEETGTACHLGAKLAFHLQCIQCIDQLRVLSESNSDDFLSSEESIDVLRILHSLTFPTYGKYWTANIFSLDDNIEALLGFVQRVKEEDKIEGKPKESEENDKEKTEQQTKKKSVRKTAGGGFSSSILLQTFKMSSNTGYLLQHKDNILNTVRCAPMSRFIEEVLEWLRPLENMKAENNVIEQCMDYIKTTFSKLEWNSVMTMGPGLCTALRILCMTTGAAENKHLTIKTLQSALQVFSGGGLSVLVDGMERINKCYKYPCYSQHALTTVFSFNFHNLLAAISESMLLLIRHLLDALLSTDDGKFDLSLLTKLLVEHYAGMYVILRESNIAKLEGITQLIVSIYGLLLRKSTTPETSTDLQEANHRTRLLQHILSATRQHCQQFAPGLLLLSHLLPLPLPIVSQGTGDGVKTEVKNQRNLWSTSLNLVAPDVNAFFSTICQSTCIPLLEILIPLAQQICDLSPTLAKNLVVSIVDACVIVEALPESQPEEESQEALDPIYTFKAHPLMVLAEIGNLPAAKQSLVEYLKLKDNKLKSLWTMAGNQAKSGSPYLLDAAIRLISALIDPDIEFVVDRHPSHNVGDVIPNNMLTDIIKLCCTALESVNLSTLIECLYCLYYLCMNNECFDELKRALSANATLLYDLLAVLVKAWDKEQDSACIALMGLCDLMQCLTLSQDGRSNSLTKSELRSFLKWDSNVKLNQHPFVVLKKRIEESDNDSDIFDQTLNQISILHANLKSHREFQRAGKKRRHPKSSESPSLAKQFDLRPWHVEGDDDTVFSCRFALLDGNSQNSILHQNVQRVNETKVDLLNIAEKNCSGFNLETSFKDLTDSAKATDIDKIRIEAKAKRLRKLETFSTRHGKTLTYIKRSHGLLMTGVRGRGRGRGSSMGRQNDLFRQRKQNTSRPPSMHVDDFIAADEEDNNSGSGGTSESYVPPVSLTPTFSTRRPPTFKRDFTPRGRGSRGMARNGSRGSYSFIGAGGNGDQVTVNEKFRSRTVGSHPSERFVRGRGRGRDPNRSFTPRDGFKQKAQQSWNFSGQRNVSGSSPGGFRGNGRVKSLMRLGRPLLPPPVNVKWSGMPPPRRGRGYGKPRGKHPRTFTR